MKILQIFKEALRSINSNRARSFLTILGIIIGVAAVIALMAAGQGAQASISSQIQSIGTNLIYVMPGSRISMLASPRSLTLADANALSNRLRAPHIRHVAPIITANSKVNYGKESEQTTIYGVKPGFEKVQNLTLTEGSFFSQSELDSRASVVVLGPALADGILGRHEGIIGMVVRINNYPFRVIGVTKSKGGGQFNNPDTFAYIPLTSMQTRVKQDSSSGKLSFILLQAEDEASVEAAISEAGLVLRESHRLNPRQADDFSITNQEDFLSIANSITGVLTIFLAGIAGISLLVGGIGIMNIMLVSVTERTSEIGLRKALGARKADIMLQFLSESAMLSLIGGILGILLGWLLALLIGFVALKAGANLSPVVGLDAVLLATLFSAAVGIFFGWYPASRAAQLQPVEALRYE
ncbi:MAG: ABC transporter permease [Anaerolineaceae bacterium]|nr:ABC transporter permease [Anaerolineaceae bacterium]